jgi:ribosome-associated protein
MRVRKILEDKKGGDIVILDVRKTSGVTDYYVLVSGTSTPHLKGMSSEVLAVLKREGVSSYRYAGDSESGWVVLDYVDVVIHMFVADLRRYYGIEELWAPAPRVP